MEYNLKKFVEKLQEKEENDLYNKELKATQKYFRASQCKPGISFKLCVSENYPSLAIFDNPDPLIDLDEEDLNYLKNKYSLKVKEEYERNLQELKNIYRQ